MEDIHKTIVLSKKIEVDTENGWRRLTVEYSDPEGDEMKKSSIEDVFNEALSKAAEIMSE